MRNGKTHSLTLKKKLSKCKSIFIAYNKLQFSYGDILESDDSVIEIKCNVKLEGCELGNSYTTDFYCVKDTGSIMVRECVYKDKLLKPLTIKLLDASRNFWLDKGVVDWGIVVCESK